MAFSDMQKVQTEVGDLDQAFPMLSPEVYEYLLTKNSGSIARSSLDAARIILLQLAQRSDETVDIFSIKGSKASAAYMDALKLYIKDSTLNPLLQNCSAWFGGQSKTEMDNFNSDLDQVKVPQPNSPSNTVLSNQVGYFIVKVA